MHMDSEPSPEVTIRARDLVKHYGRRRALNGLDLTVPAGGVHVLLGPNGSGKTTTLRILMGLAHASSGSVEIFGRRVPRHLPSVIDRIGAVVESPGFHPNFSARRNLEILATAIGLPLIRVSEALERFGIADVARQRTRSLSLGERQRLALAATSLKSPDLYILDEPTNGLDPGSIMELRHMIFDMRDRGSTVLLSTHLLSEAEQVADTVTIIDAGRVVAHGTLAEVSRAATPGIRVGVTEPQRALRILSEHDFDVRCDGDHLDVSGPVDRAMAARITALLAREGLYLHELTTTSSLESSFLELVGDHR